MCEEIRCPWCNSNLSSKINCDGLMSECENCGLIYLTDMPKEIDKLYQQDYSVWSNVDEEKEKIISQAKKQTFEYLLEKVSDILKGMNISGNPQGKKLLDVGTGRGYLLDVAEEMGYECCGIEISKQNAEEARKRFPNKIFTGTLEDADYGEHFFDVITLTDIIEHINNPNTFFEKICHILKPGGIIVITTPNTDSFTRKMMGKNWFQYKPEHIIYWNKKSLRSILDFFSFDILEMSNNRKRLDLNYYESYFKKYPSAMGSVFNMSAKGLPAYVKKKPFLNPITGELLVIAKWRGDYRNR